MTLMYVNMFYGKISILFKLILCYTSCRPGDVGPELAGSYGITITLHFTAYLYAFDKYNFVNLQQGP